MNNFDTLYQTLMLEFSEAAIKKFVLKFKDEAPEETIRKELADFERYKSRLSIKDPNQYDSWTSLFKAVSSARDVSQTEKGTKKPSNSSESGMGPNLAKPEDANVLEIYEGDSEDKCILYGKGYSFCISRQAGGNMYDSYRSDKSSTFYFIYFKDKSKDENDHIMVLDHTDRGYEWTFKDNKTQKVQGGWDEIVEKYPILDKYRDIFVNKKLGNDERKRIEAVYEFSLEPTLERFNSFDHKLKIKALRSIITGFLPDEIFKTLNSFLINEFLSVGPNLTDYQADSLKPNQVKWYIEKREESMPGLLNNSALKYNKHDANVPYMIKIMDRDQKTAEDRISSYKEEIKNYKPSENESILSRPGISFTGLYLTKLPSGIPDVILGGFGTMGTLITSLEGGPTYVGGVFTCGNNIQSLKGAPKYVGGFFECGSTKITSLEGAPIYVGTYFSCKNTKITSLKDAPKYVGGNFNCSETLITTLEGAPTYVGGDFACNKIPTLVSLEGAPRRIGGGIDYINTNASAKGAPKEIGGDLNISDIEITPEEEAHIVAVKLRSERMREWGRQFSASLQTKIKNLVFQKSVISESHKYSQIQLLENLRDWFKPHVDKKGKKFKGWINCKTSGPCGRKNTSKGSYPACRPTKAQCKSIKGKMYKKKSSKRVNWKKKSS